MSAPRLFEPPPQPAKFIASDDVISPFAQDRTNSASIFKRTLQLVSMMAGTIAGLGEETSADDSLYLESVKPLLMEKCVSCHGPLKQEAGLRLDAANLINAGSESGAVLNTDSAQDSLLIERIVADDSERMPPADEGERLTADQIAILRKWIESGATGPADEPISSGPEDHWAYQPIVRPEIPEVLKDTDAHPIDQFIATGQQRNGLHPAERADRATLIRRLMFDLIGLPPTPEQIDDFVSSADPSTYENLVDELLQSPRYGERWGRHWMDVWRYSDWDGYKQQLRGSQRHIWHWRDWIIESLNEDKGYDQMVLEMLAGDELAPDDPQTYRATGYLARNFHKSNRNIWLDATVEHTAKAFLGTTINCARCHDHKFDPIPQTDYYAFRAIFEPHDVRTERLPGQSDLMKAGIPRAFDAEPEAKTFLYHNGDEKHPDEENPLAPQTVSFVDLPYEPNPVELSDIGYFPSLAEHIAREDLAAAKEKLKKALAALDKISHPSVELNSVERDGQPPSPMLPTTLPIEVQLAESRLRVAEQRLASLESRWAADRAKASSKDGTCDQQLQERAKQQERRFAISDAKLDVLEKWSAADTVFAKPDADEKKQAEKVKKAREALEKSRQSLAKTVGKWKKPDQSYTPVGKFYPRTSTGRRLALAKWIVHPENPLTARVAVNHIWTRHFGRPLVANMFDFGLRSPQPKQVQLLDWLACELRESGWSMKHLHRLILTSQTWQRTSRPSPDITAHNSEIDPDNQYYWKANVRRLEAEVVRDSLLQTAGMLDLKMGGADLPPEQGEKVYRRSVYFRHAYEKQMQMMVLFDAASPNECYRRSPSIIPQQALALANSELSFQSGKKIAESIASHLGEASDPAAFVVHAFHRILGREPDEDELAVCISFLAEQEPVAGRGESLRRLVHVLLNHNDFVTVR